MISVGMSPSQLPAGIGAERRLISVTSLVDLLDRSFAYGVWPEKDWQETLGCQFTNAPFGFSFHAQTCSV